MGGWSDAKSLGPLPGIKLCTSPDLPGAQAGFAVWDWLKFVIPSMVATNNRGDLMIKHILKHSQNEIVWICLVLFWFVVHWHPILESHACCFTTGQLFMAIMVVKMLFEYWTQLELYLLDASVKHGNILFVWSVCSCHLPDLASTRPSSRYALVCSLLPRTVFQVYYFVSSCFLFAQSPNAMICDYETNWLRCDNWWWVGPIPRYPTWVGVVHLQSCSFRLAPSGKDGTGPGHLPSLRQKLRILGQSIKDGMGDVIKKHI
jgi:hypothetical protein